MKEAFTQPSQDVTIHCCCCIHLGKATPATWRIDGPIVSYLYGCDTHADELDELSLKAINKYRKTTSSM